VSRYIIVHELIGSCHCVFPSKTRVFVDIFAAFFSAMPCVLVASKLGEAGKLCSLLLVGR